MPSVGVIGSNAGEVTHVYTHICQAGGHCADVVCIREDSLQERVNVLVAMDASPWLARAVPLLESGDYLLINADERAIFPLLAQSKAGLITFGFNGKACITASSVTDGVLQVCIQRGFRTINNRPREPQEFAVPYPSGVSVSAVLGAVAACAVCERL